MEDLSSPTVAGLSAADLAVLGFSIGVMLLIGWWTGRKERTTESFFLGGRSIPGWAACLSFVATEISAMTIVGVPADSYRSNWNYAQFFIGSALARVAVAFLFIPAFYACRCTTIYEFLRGRFGPGTQYTATGFFFVTRLLASGVRLYIAALAVSKILGWSLLASVTGFTIVGIAFIGYGGIRAVIWTNVFQALVFMGAGFMVLGFINGEIDGGLSGVFSSVFPIGADAAARAAGSGIPAAKAVFATAAETGSRLPYFINTAWDSGAYPAGTAMATLHAVFAAPSAIWIGVLAGFFLSLASFGTDQENMQRLLTVETRRESQRMILWTVLAGGAVLMTYLAIGSGIAAWVAAHPAAVLPVKTDEIFPWFISNVLPHGLKGVLLAAIVLASIDSPLSSLSTSAITDLYKPLVRSNAPDAHYLLLSRVAIAVFGLLLGGLAMFFSRFDGILWVAFKIGSVTFGSLLGVFLYGLMTRAPARRAPVFAMFASAAIMATLLVLIESKVLWLAWSWLVIAGTGLTMLFVRVFSLAMGEAGAPAPAPAAGATSVAPLALETT